MGTSRSKWTSEVATTEVKESGKKKKKKTVTQRPCSLTGFVLLKYYEQKGFLCQTCVSPKDTRRT